MKNSISKRHNMKNKVHIRKTKKKIKIKPEIKVLIQQGWKIEIKQNIKKT